MAVLGLAKRRHWRAGGIATVPPPALVLLSIVSVQLGAALTKGRFAASPSPCGRVLARSVPVTISAGCWALRDYITLSPSKLNDALALLAFERRDRIIARIRAIVAVNLRTAARTLPDADPQVCAAGLARSAACLADIRASGAALRSGGTCAAPEMKQQERGPGRLTASARYPRRS
jgi:hypothetical protein